MPDSASKHRRAAGHERSRLKDALRAINSWQEKAAYHYRTDTF